LVEVDSTFYRSPARKTVEGWRDRTPPGFGFALKVPQSITHEKVLLNCQDDVSRFLSAVRVLGEKLLCCTLQFGYFNRGKFATLNAFLDRLEPFLAAWPADVPLAVEVRNKTWMTAALGGCLRRHNAVWVLPDQAWMPSPLSVVQRLDVVTGPFAYVRLLGDREAVDALTDTLDHIVIDRGEQVVEDAMAIGLLRRRVPVVAFVNNHFAGYAPETVRQLVALTAPPHQRVDSDAVGDVFHRGLPPGSPLHDTAWQVFAGQAGGFCILQSGMQYFRIFSYVLSNDRLALQPIPISCTKDRDIEEPGLERRGLVVRHDRHGKVTVAAVILPRAATNHSAMSGRSKELDMSGGTPISPVGSCGKSPEVRGAIIRPAGLLHQLDTQHGLATTVFRDGTLTASLISRSFSPSTRLLGGPTNASGRRHFSVDSRAQGRRRRRRAAVVARLFRATGHASSRQAPGRTSPRGR
jgi:uncharacterized protein YecE (DUF72 family)